MSTRRSPSHVPLVELSIVLVVICLVVVSFVGLVMSTWTPVEANIPNERTTITSRQSLSSAAPDSSLFNIALEEEETGSTSDEDVLDDLKDYELV